MLEQWVCIVAERMHLSHSLRIVVKVSKTKDSSPRVIEVAKKCKNNNQTRKKLALSTTQKTMTSFRTSERKTQKGNEKHELRRNRRYEHKGYYTIN